MNKPTSLRSFFEDRLHLSLATAAGLCVAVGIGLVGVGYAGNPVKNVMMILGAAMLILASLRPYFGLYLLIVSSASLDFVKRFLVLFGTGSMGDVMGVLAVAPMILAGMFLGIFVLHPIFTKRMLNQDERRLTLLAMIPIGISLASGFRNGGSLFEIVGYATNKSAYFLLIPTVYALYRRTGLGELTKLLRFLVAVYLPVAIYGIHQYFFGFTQFEIDYLRSGLTSTAGNLYEAHPRAFSTLNSPHAFGIAMGIMVLLSLTLCRQSLRAPSGFFSTRGRWLLPLIFAVASTLSLARSGWAVTMLGLFGMFAFRTKLRVMAFYISFTLLFSVLVWKADVIYSRLDEFQRYLPSDTAFQQGAFQLGTYSERLYGFQNVFNNRSMWTWFGNPDLAYNVHSAAARDDIVHDALGQALVAYGIVGLFAIIAIGGVSLFVLHRRILAMRSGSAALLGRGLLSLCMAVFFGGMLTGSHLGVFPINLLFWAFAGSLVVVSRKQAASPVLAEVPLPPATVSHTPHSNPRLPLFPSNPR